LRRLRFHLIFDLGIAKSSVKQLFG
jgi:hypothetical protein